MRKVFLILILGLLNFQTNVFSSDKIINQLKKQNIMLELSGDQWNLKIKK